FYVALTRARQRLYVTAAWWYLRQSKPRGPSTFFDEVAADPETEVLPAADMPPENPLLASLSELAVWPPDPPNRLRRDGLFPGGPRRRAASASRSTAGSRSRPAA